MIIKTTGMFDVEFRIVVACRENSVCVLRRGWLEGRSVVQLTDNIVDMILIPGDNFIVIATSSKLLHCYTKRVGPRALCGIFDQAFFPTGTKSLVCRDGEPSDLPVLGPVEAPEHPFDSGGAERRLGAPLPRAPSRRLHQLT
jgi:hypothetical protein